MTSRRSFLRALSLSPVAAPMAAKATIDAATAELSGISLLGSFSNSLGNPAGGTLVGIPTSSQPWWKKASQYFMRHALPDFVERRAREHARHVSSIDPDIACKRSWSFSVKIQHQRQRNYERYKQQILRSHEEHADAQTFFERHGFWL